MTTFALVGAGPGLGLASARRFGAAGHEVALLSRSAEHLERPVADLTGVGVQARSHTADVLDPASLATAAEDLDPVEILQFSPCAVRPHPERAGTSIAFAAESAYAAMLHYVLAPQNIHAAQLIVPGAIRPDSEHSSPTALAERLYALHSERAGFRHYAEPMPAP